MMAECACGCGAIVARQYAKGHNRRLQGNRNAYVAEDRGYSSPCFIWQGLLSVEGYGRLWREGRVIGAHRAAYVDARGSVPPGLVIDHLCRNRSCVNPAHLEAVTNAENVSRGLAYARRNECRRGHPLTGDNLGVDASHGRSFCKHCKRDGRRAREAQAA